MVASNGLKVYKVTAKTILENCLPVQTACLCLPPVRQFYRRSADRPRSWGRSFETTDGNGHGVNSNSVFDCRAAKSQEFMLIHV